MASIISCSRRTDIPAFYAPWLMNRLRAGFCHTLNPFGGQVYRIPLSPDDVVALTFWTRNPGPMQKYLDELKASGYPFFFSITMTGYPAPFEPHSPSLEAALRTFKDFSNRISPLRMRWRYDPIVISSVTPEAYHLRRFEELAHALEGYTTHCTFSFVQFYGKTSRNMGEAAARAGITVEHPDLLQQQALAGRLAQIAAQHGISFNSCCDDHLLVEGVTKSHCIDPQLIRAIAPGYVETKGRPTRPDCGCAASIDIGEYDTCLFGCAYCYATTNHRTARLNHAAHDPQDTLLFRPRNLQGVDLDAVATPRKSV